MKDKLIKKYISYIKANYKYNENQIELIKYSIDSLILSLTKFIPILLIAIVLDIANLFLLTVLFTKPIRYTSFGYHARNSIECFTLSIMLFILIPFFINKYTLRFKYLIFFIGFVNHLLFSPSDTKKRPLKNKKKRKTRKIITILIIIIYFLLTFIVNKYLESIIITSIVISIILTNPFIYLITKEPYRNHINRKEDI